MLILQAEHLQVGEHAKAQCFGSDRQRHGDHRRLDLAGFERRESRRLSANLQDRNIFFRHQAKFLEGIAGGEIRGRTKSAYRHGFPFELLGSADAFVNHQLII
jgi:hypothetical protein